MTKRAFVLTFSLLLVLSLTALAPAGVGSAAVRTKTPRPRLPTATVAVPTATVSVPTATAPSPTAPPQAGAPYYTAPLCPDHNGRAYHTLWNAAQGCHYNHDHGDNPHLLDYRVHGLDLYGVMGGEISHPWQTMSAAGCLENDCKHAGYAWHVRDNLPCDVAPCITAFRVLVHQHATDRDATVQFHSVASEFWTSDGGYFCCGFQADFGDLHSPVGTVIVDVPFNHDSYACGGNGRHKQHNPPGGAPQEIWYGASLRWTDQCGPRGFVTVSTSVHDVWDWTDPANPSLLTDYVCYGTVDPHRCRSNGNLRRAHLIGLEIVTTWPFIFDGTGHANWRGWGDRYGRPMETSTCAAVSADCIPMVFENLAQGVSYGAATSQTAQLYKDYDIYFCPSGGGWVECQRSSQGSVSAGWSEPVP